MTGIRIVKESLSSEAIEALSQQHFDKGNSVDGARSTVNNLAATNKGRKAEIKAKKEAEEAKRAEEARLAEEARIAEETRAAEEAKRAEDEAAKAQPDNTDDASPLQLPTAVPQEQAMLTQEPVTASGEIASVDTDL